MIGVYIPDSVTSIGDYAFANNKMTDVRVMATIPPLLGWGAFGIVLPNSNFRIYVPTGSGYTYSRSIGWNTYERFIR